MDPHILIACTGALINMALSVTVPCLLKDSKQSFMKDIKEVFKLHRQVIITSSLIVALTIYLALKLTPDISSRLQELTSLNFDSAPESDEISQPVSRFIKKPLIISREYPQELNGQELNGYSQKNFQQMPPQLLNLIKLMHN